MENYLSQNYFNLYTRNVPLISLETQYQISKLKIAVAGCGSTGGAFIDGALRLGIQSFHLSDSGYYEVNNLNRQMVDLSYLGKNKAKAYGEKIKNVNNEARIKIWDRGLNENNVGLFLDNIDFLFDAIDVTTESGMKIKLLLHEKAAENKIPTGSALDLGLTQWLQSFNYHQDVPALNGRLNKAKLFNNPLKALFAGFIDIEELNADISDEIIRILANPQGSVCQLAGACFLLSSMVTPYLLYFLQSKSLPKLTVVDIESYFFNKTTTESLTKKELSHKKLKEILQLIT